MCGIYWVELWLSLIHIYVETKGKTIYLRTHTIGIEATIYYKILPGNPDLQISALDSQQIEQIRIKAVSYTHLTHMT